MVLSLRAVLFNPSQLLGMVIVTIILRRNRTRATVGKCSDPKLKWRQLLNSNSSVGKEITILGVQLASSLMIRAIWGLTYH